jgi:colanic acid/amylovoran biosynthesis glycosyltransferase
MEAMAMEIPCVTTYITGIPELIRDGIDGLLVAAVRRRRAGRGHRAAGPRAGAAPRLGQAGRQRVLDKYDLGPQHRAHGGRVRERLDAAAR